MIRESVDQCRDMSTLTARMAVVGWKSLYVQVGLGCMNKQYGRATVIVRALRRGKNKKNEAKLMRIPRVTAEAAYAGIGRSDFGGTCRYGLFISAAIGLASGTAAAARQQG